MCTFCEFPCSWLQLSAVFCIHLALLDEITHNQTQNLHYALVVPWYINYVWTNLLVSKQAQRRTDLINLYFPIFHVSMLTAHEWGFLPLKYLSWWDFLHLKYFQNAYTFWSVTNWRFLGKSILYTKIMSTPILLVVHVLNLIKEQWGGLPVSALTSKELGSHPHNKKKTWANWKSMTFLRSIWESRFQGKPPPRNLERQAHVENHSQMQNSFPFCTSGAV